MRNLRKRRKLIRQMEQANKIPDKLMPQEIKDMLDDPLSKILQIVQR